MRFHILGLAHIQTKKEIAPCAYTQKIYKLCQMLKDLKNEVIFYGVEGSKVKCDKFVSCLSTKDWKKQFGDYNWRKEQFDTGEGKGEAWQKFRLSAAQNLQRNIKPKDFVLCSMGCWHQPIVEKVKGKFLTVESGIGYSGIFAKFKVFESYAWMHYLYGTMKLARGLLYDTVIPNYYDPKDFKYSQDKDDYCLFIGRLVYQKGVDIAVDVCRLTGNKLIVAGQTTPETNAKWIKSKHVEYVGVVDHKERSRLMANAKCVFVPTYYIEPFGGVNVEAQLCGTPVITTDFGVFSETVLQGVTGYRCATLAEFKWAVENVHKLNPMDCRTWAIQNYSMDVIGKRYQHYFERLYDLWDTPGWPYIRKTDLDCRRIRLPNDEC